MNLGFDNIRHYNIGLIDLSYILMRNVYAASRGKKPGEFSAGDIVRMTIQTLNKIIRDYGFSVDKYVFLRDQWSREHKGYYRTVMLQGDYKDTRVYIDRVKLNEMKNDPNITSEQLEDAETKCYINEVKSEAKRLIINELGKFGLPTIGFEGYEYDDLAYISAAMLYGTGLKSIFITKDSDLQYALTPKTDFFRMPTGGSKPEFITYNQMYDTIPDLLKNKMGLYQYKAFRDSLGLGHNDMRKTIKPNQDPDGVILQVLGGDFSGLTDPELFLKQYNTFMVEKFPNFQEARELLRSNLLSCGRLGTAEEFKEFCNHNGVFGISEKYFTEFTNRLNKKYYCE